MNQLKILVLTTFHMMNLFKKKSPKDDYEKMFVCN